jgi:hypothetical protein
MNQFHGESPVIFSALPGATVETAQDPDDPDSSLGPLARRIKILQRTALDKGRKLSIADFLHQLMQIQLDAGTRPPVSNFEETAWTQSPFFGHP